MRRYGKHTDEDDIPSRPNRKGNRPRTNIRPKHEEAVEGMVLTVDRGRLTCLVDNRVVMTIKARELGRKAAVVGDRVAIIGDLSGDKDTLARIVRIAPRTSVLRRTADDDDPYERVVVANADQLAIVTALADPEPRPPPLPPAPRRPGTPPPSDRPLPGGRLRRWPDPPPGPDEVGPGPARQA